LRKALEIDAQNKQAKDLLIQIEDTAEQLRNSSMSLSLSNRVADALNKLNGAISMNPLKAEYNLQRGIIHKRMKNFNSAIDDFLVGLEKINNDQTKEPVLFANFQRHILLTYNDFAIVCFEKKFYDDAIILLNKAIKIDKSEKGFYVNRGDCFCKKNETQFAILDFEQALELDPHDQTVSRRIGKICYEMAVKKYDNKEYEEATKHFEKAIRYVPTEVKYYLSRARTYYFMEDLDNAQIDICICILLDPTNHEIPTIINRIFANQNLNDVLQSEPMNIAKMYLSSLKIKNVFEYKLSILLDFNFNYFNFTY
jgi:tetratricopeptide (TPR) repeat protein